MSLRLRLCQLSRGKNKARRQPKDVAKIIFTQDYRTILQGIMCKFSLKKSFTKGSTTQNVLKVLAQQKPGLAQVQGPKPPSERTTHPDAAQERGCLRLGCGTHGPLVCAPVSWFDKTQTEPHYFTFFFAVLGWGLTEPHPHHCVLTQTGFFWCFFPTAPY